MSAEAFKSGRLETRPGYSPELARAAQVNGKRIKFAQRHPIVTYLLLPIPALALLWTAYTLGLAGVLSGFHSFKDTLWAVTAANLLIHGLAYVPAVVLTLVIAWIAAHSETRIVWWLVASLLVAVVSSLMLVTFRMPTTPGTGRLQVGLGFPPDLSHWPQFVVPLAVAGAMVSIAVKKRRSRQQPASM